MNIDALGLTPYATMLAKAIQEYGMVVQDRAGHATFFAEDAAQFACNPYFSVCSGQAPIMTSGNPTEVGELANFPWLSLQVVAMPVGGF